MNLTHVKQVIGNLRPGRIIFVAVLLRLLFAVFWAVFIDVPSENIPLKGDTYFQAGADGYLQIAHTLLHSGEYAFYEGGPPVHNRGPVQPALFMIFGSWCVDYWYFFWFLGSALISFLYLTVSSKLAKGLGFSRLNINLTLLLIGFHPYLIFISKTSTFINIAMLELVLVVFLFFRIPRRPFPYAGLAGLAMGVGALTHGTFLMLPLFAIPLLLSRKSMLFADRLKSSLLVVVAAALVVLPWTYRNYVTFDMVIPVVTGSGYHYWKGDAVYFGGDYRMRKIYYELTGKEAEMMYFGFVDAEADRVLWEAAKRDMIDRPQLIPLRLIIGTGAFLAPWAGTTGKQLVAALLNIPLTLLLIWLAIRNFRHRRLRYEQYVIGGLLLYIVEAFSFFVSWGSYFNMLVPVTMVLLVSLLEERNKKQFISS